MNWPTGCKRPVGWSHAAAFRKSGGERFCLCVHDFQLHYFADVFRVPAVAFVPTLDLSKPIDETLSRLIYNEKHGLAPKPNKMFDAALFAASGKAA